MIRKWQGDRTGALNETEDTDFRRRCKSQTVASKVL